MAKKAKKTSSKKSTKTPITFRARIQQAPSVVKGRIRGLLRRRPHRSFRRTVRRDYSRPLKLPGYWAFTNEVKKTLWSHKKIFFSLVIVYAALTAVIVGIISQTYYTDFTDALRESGSKLFEGQLWQIGQAGVTLTAGILGTLNDAPGDAEKLAAIILGLMVWLTTVWLLRAISTGGKPRLRDGLYNAGAPFISTLLVFIVALIQLLPVALAIIAFAAASTSGLINEGIESMIFWVFELLLFTLSMYWLGSTLFAMIIVTLPGVYPMRALSTAGDLVIGRRIRILLRFMWLLGVTFFAWVVIMIPIILFDTWLKEVWSAISWLPLVPICLLVMASLSIVWFSAYTYLLYRKVVDDGAAPA